jgi:hypothetical protein
MRPHLPLHIHGPAHRSLDFVGGLATRQFRVTVCWGLRGVRRGLGALVAERVAFHLSSGGCTTASAHFWTSGCCAGSASIAGEEEAGAGEEQDADDAADDDAGDSTAGEAFAG